MCGIFKVFFSIVILLPFSLPAQTFSSAIVYDDVTKETLPFCTIKYNNGHNGLIGNLDGSFSLDNLKLNKNEDYIEVSCLGYHTTKVKVPLEKRSIYLQPVNNLLKEVTIKIPNEKIKRILNNTINNKHKNNPDLYDRYQCHVYYKLLVDASPSDSLRVDTSSEARKKAAFLENQHLMLSETYSIRTWERPRKLQEEILSTRLSGLKKSIFTGTVTDILPFHAYENYITLNGKDYHNPISKGYWTRYRFGLSEELMSGNDTIWVLTFKPKSKTSDLLKGKVFIHSNGYAISDIIAETRDTILRQAVRIEQQYRQIPYNDSLIRWFPSQLNYIIDREMTSEKGKYTLFIKGNSVIDSVTFPVDKQFKFDKRHTITLRPDATTNGATMLAKLRPEPLKPKETRTYRVIDSIGEEIHADEMIDRFQNLSKGRLGLGVLDFDFQRLLNYNVHEGFRLGAGLQTNDKLLKWLSVGGWAGYGFKDKQWKYGAFAEVYADRNKEFVFRGSYTNEIETPGQIKLNKDLDKNNLRMLLLQRVDKTQTYALCISKKIAYWDAELSGSYQEIQPQYPYALILDGRKHQEFTAKEASLNLRYAYAERTSPFMGSYYSVGSNYPIWYGKLTVGSLLAGTTENNYSKITTALSWHKHINRIGNEHFLIEAGKIWSQSPLPISKLFAGNGYRYDDRSALSLYAFGGLLTMPPNGYYTDKFVQFLYRHDFDKKLYRLESPKSVFSSIPFIGVQYNALYGLMNNQSSHLYTEISVPSSIYQEAGVLISNLLRMRAGNLYYLSFNAGYFYHLNTMFDLEKNGKIVFGFGVEL